MLLTLGLSLVVLANPPATFTTHPLKKFNVLIGDWKGTGTPEGTATQRRDGFWTETIHWEWRFQNDDAWLFAQFENGKQFLRGELRYSSQRSQYEFQLTDHHKHTLTYVGQLTDTGNRSPVLTLERTDPTTKTTERFVLTLLHTNRYLYRLETRPESGTTFAKRYQVGATKKGVPFASAKQGPECIVSGGAGTMKVTYKGKDYFVCCSGCKDAFLDDPEKFIADARKKPE
ncbi:MAG: YHS domain-containing protein [Bacteroidales bacterium]|nr:YHS domain-containing protein [Bacteroidales bacterium]